MNTNVPHPEAEHHTTTVSFRKIQSLVQDLKTPKAWIYWTDFLVTILSGHLLFKVLVFAGTWWSTEPTKAFWVRAIAFPVTVALYLRAAMFIHELVHLPRDGFRLFRIAWNGLCGIFFLIPSFMYYPHVDHHRRHTYGTEHDGEYLPLSHRPAWYLAGFILQSLLIPILGFLRFLLISPLCWIFPPLRPWVHRHLSTMIVDPFYQRGSPSKSELRNVLLQEFACFIWCVVLVYRGLWYWGEWLNPLWITGYCVGVGVVTLNAVRTLGAHRWSGNGEQMAFETQLLDSVNFPHRPWITEIWGPVGTRYHALHHLLPSLPYHNMPEAHRRLMRELPENAPYRRTECVSLTRAIWELYQRAKRSSGQPRESWTTVQRV